MGLRAKRSTQSVFDASLPRSQSFEKGSSRTQYTATVMLCSATRRRVIPTGLTILRESQYLANPLWCWHPSFQCYLLCEPHKHKYPRGTRRATLVVTLHTCCETAPTWGCQTQTWNTMCHGPRQIWGSGGPVMATTYTRSRSDYRVPTGLKSRTSVNSPT